MLVSIIIPVFNNLSYTVRCLKAISESLGSTGYEIIVVDNGSTDGTGGFLANYRGNLRVISNSANLGFVDACNQGAQAARGKYLVFLNNDTEPLPGWLDELAGLAEKEPKVGAVGAKLVYPDGRLQEAGAIIWKNGAGWNYGRGEDPRRPQYSFVREVDYCSGACLLIRRELFTGLGGFDSRYAPGYYEDADLCFGVRARGYRVLYNPRAVVIHQEGATAGRNLSAGMKQYQQVNQRKFTEKWGLVLAGQYDFDLANVTRAATRNRGRNILVADRTMPLYDRASGCLRIFNILKLMRKAGHFLTYIADNGVMQERYIDELERLGIEVFAPGAVRTGTLGEGVEFRNILSWIMAVRTYDLVWLSFYDVAERYLEPVRQLSPGTKVVIDTVDIHFLREGRMAEVTGDRQMADQAAATKARELAVYPRADLVIAVTEEDRQVLLRENPQLKVAVIPNFLEEAPASAPFEERTGLIFVGNFSHQPNADAMTFFVGQIWPLIKSKLPGIKLFVVGNRSDEFCAYEDQDIEVTGFVPDTRPYLQSCRVSVAPLRFGAGMKGKINEAIVSGIPVVTTSIGAEGFNLQNGVHALVADTPDDFAGAVIRLYNDKQLWQRLVENSQDHIWRNFSPARVAEQLNEIITPQDCSRRTGSEKISGLTSIIILTCNQLEYTKLCLDSIRLYTPQPREIIVVDNSSADGTVEYLQSQKDLLLIRNRENRGFAKGCNQGIKAAAGDYVLLLNNDTVVAPGWLRNMIYCMESDRSIGIVGPRSNFAKPPQYLPVTYDNLDEMLRFATGFNLKPDPSKWFILTMAVGFCMLISRQVIEKAGLLDEQFGIGFFEDDDYCHRAEALGFKIICAGDTFVHHFGNRTFIGNKVDTRQLVQESWEKYLAKWPDRQ